MDVFLAAGVSIQIKYGEPLADTVMFRNLSPLRSLPDVRGHGGGVSGGEEAGDEEAGVRGAGWRIEGGGWRAQVE